MSLILWASETQCRENPVYWLCLLLQSSTLNDINGTSTHVQLFLDERQLAFHRSDLALLGGQLRILLLE